MISQEHVTKGQCNFMARSPSSYHPAKFGGHKHSGTGDIIFLADHVISQYHVIKESFDLMSWTTHDKSPT